MLNTDNWRLMLIRCECGERRSFFRAPFFVCPYCNSSGIRIFVEAFVSKFEFVCSSCGCVSIFRINHLSGSPKCHAILPLFLPEGSELVDDECFTTVACGCGRVLLFTKVTDVGSLGGIGIPSVCVEGSHVLFGSNAVVA